MTEEKKQSLHPISRSLCKAYSILFLKREVFFPLEDTHADKIDVIVKTVYGTWFGFTRFPTYEDQAVAFFCLIIKDHPMTDGNKRLAVLWLETFCEVHKLKMDLSRMPLDVLAVSVEQTKQMDNDQLFGLVKIILFGNRNTQSKFDKKGQIE